MHSDVTGLPLRVTSSDACLLGAAVLASVGAGAHTSIRQAVTAMVKVHVAYNSVDTMCIKIQHSLVCSASTGTHNSMLSCYNIIMPAGRAYNITRYGCARGI
jgi:ribulose kinase